MMMAELRNRSPWFLLACVFVAFGFALASLECPKEFEGKCECGLVPRGGTKVIKFDYVVSCVDSGFDHTMMLRKLPAETEVLIFTGNEVKDLPLNIFGQDVVYNHLHTIDFSNNNIQSIKGRTFHNVANVTKLVLNDNDLYIVSKDHHPRMFSNFENLRELHLRNAFTEKVKAGDYLDNLGEIFGNSSLNHLQILNLEDNEISGIYHGEFCSLPSLEQLHLADNHLKDVPLNFSCLKNLKLLDVGNNAISRLGDSTIKSLKEVVHLRLNLTHNPFKCDCNLVETVNWMKNTTVFLIGKDKFYCYDGYPLNVGQSVLSLPQDRFRCYPELSEVSRAYGSSTLYILLSITLFLGLCVTVVLVLRYRETLGITVNRALHPILNKFSYSTLGRRDVMDF